MKNSLLVTTALTLGVLLMSTLAFSDQGALGVWQTDSNGDGYLHVTIEPCGDLLCGTIKMAYNAEGEASDTYEHIGKKMIWGMKPKTDTSWRGGKIWDPSADKTYKSKMSVSSDTLSVSGCVLLFCKAQEWTRVK